MKTDSAKIIQEAKWIISKFKTRQALNLLKLHCQTSFADFANMYAYAQPLGDLSFSKRGDVRQIYEDALLKMSVTKQHHAAI